MKRVSAFVLATLGVAFLTAVILYLGFEKSAANVSMLYLIVVIACALFLGRGAAIWASLCSFFAFNWFFLNPKYTLSVDEPTEWIALCMFLLIATVTGQLMAMLKLRAQEARQHQRETAALADASWAVASQLDTDSALSEVLKQVAQVVELDLVAVIAIKGGDAYTTAMYTAGSGAADGQTDLDLLMKHLYSPGFKPVGGAIAFSIPEQIKKPGIICLPILMNDRMLGFVFIKMTDGKTLSIGQKQIIDSLISHSAVILQRDDLIKTETKAAALIDANRLKTALLSMVSHDFRSPLTSIKASVSTLMQDGEPLDNETQRGLCQTIDQETDRLNRMVGNILDYSRLESDAWQPKFEPTPVSELIGMTLDAFDANNNQRIQVQLDPELNEISVDCVQMIQVLKNLIENALKYSDGSVEIQTKRSDGTALIEVLDRGKGIADVDAERLFEPFYRASSLQESSTPGVGIGLAICRGLVESHSGNLTAENREGGGAIFRVSLPLKNETVAK